MQVSPLELSLLGERFAEPICEQLLCRCGRITGVGQAMKLIGRHTECCELDRLVEAVRAGQSRAIVLCGEAGVGKTALLDYVAEQASDCRVIRAAGVQSEMELPFA